MNSNNNDPPPLPHQKKKKSPNTFVPVLIKKTSNLHLKLMLVWKYNPEQWQKKMLHTF